MASGKRASMREGPLAELFRKTDDEGGPQPSRKQEREPEKAPPPKKRAPEPPAPEPAQGFEQRATEAARRAEEREARRREREERWSRYEGVPTPEERLRTVFSTDIPENILDREPAPAVTRDLEPHEGPGVPPSRAR